MEKMLATSILKRQGFKYFSKFLNELIEDSIMHNVKIKFGDIDKVSVFGILGKIYY